MKKDIIESYERYLRHSRSVSEELLGYYIMWSRKFINHILDLRTDDDAKLLESFRHFLEQRYESWQVRQALDGAELYLYHFLQTVNHGRKESFIRGFDKLKVRLVKELVEAMALLRYSGRTVKSYSDWVERYFFYCERTKIDFKAVGSIKEYLEYLCLEKNVSASTQNQAFNALIFFFKQVLNVDPVGLRDTVRAKISETLPVFLSVEEIKRLLRQVHGRERLMLELLYGTGLRVAELVGIRVQDISFDDMNLVVRDGKGNKDRVIPLPFKSVKLLKEQLAVSEAHFKKEIVGCERKIELPDALAKKYRNECKTWLWYWLFPGRKGKGNDEGLIKGLNIRSIQRIVCNAAEDAEIDKVVTPHTLRHTYATHMVVNGCNIRVLQDLMGHKSLETTMIYVHAAGGVARTFKSPLDAIFTYRNK